ncbi:NmrA domain-containing protein [Favolaschia claudopus]|uniref:NmrA domain-containing protein n=1 Tax=Favolaschia claudopus TaxID=2862362 RepID=A0AAW0AXN5_9AGAR
MSSRIVSVFGATGDQGSGVIDLLLQDGTFVPRAFTRDANSAASKELKARGVEVVQVDTLDKSQLVAALRGSEAAFVVTTPIFVVDVEGTDEITQGKNIINAAKEAGVQFLIISSLPSLNRISGGKYTNIIQYDDKETIREYLASSGVKHASLLLPAFLENCWKFGQLKKTDDGHGYLLSLPRYKADQLQAFVWVQRDVAAAVLALLKNYQDPTKEIDGKTYPVVNGRMTYSELAEMISKVLNAKVTFTTGPSSGLAELDDMWSALAENSGLYLDTPVPNPELVALGAKISTIEEFLETEIKARYGR